MLSTPPSPIAIVPDLDPAFCSIVAKGMARDVEHRFQTAVQFAEAIDNWARTGAAVTVPPELQQQGFVPNAVGPAAGQNLGSSALQGGASALQGGATPGAGGIPKQSAQSWATSQPEAPVDIPKKSNGAIVGVAVVAAIGVLGGGAFAAYKFLGNGGKAESTQAVITSEPAKAAAPIDPPPAPPAVVEPKAPEAKPAETAPSATPAQPKVEPHAVPGKSRPVAAPALPHPAPGKPPAKPSGTAAPDFGY